MAGVDISTSQGETKMIVKIKLSNQIEITAMPEIEKQIIEQFTFANPKYQDALSFGRSTYNLDRRICLIDTTEESLKAPMGILGYLQENFELEIEDYRTAVGAKIPFTGTLRPYQETFVDKAINAKGGQMVAATGSGKCLGIDTPVLMFDGSIKRVQDVVVGDKLMGADSTPRNVLSLARGREQMYWVRQKRGGIDYRVNESHILSIRKGREEGAGHRGDLLDISLTDYVILP